MLRGTKATKALCQLEMSLKTNFLFKPLFQAKNKFHVVDQLNSTSVIYLV